MSAKWDGAPDQGLLEQKGGIGSPYCVLMDTGGEVVWEVRPDSEKTWRNALALARRLQAARSRLTDSEDQPALEATVALLDAMGRDQRPKRALSELDLLAKVDGIEPEVLAAFRPWRLVEEFKRAVYEARRDGGVSAYEVFRSGRRPEDETGGLSFAFYRAALDGAILAGEAEDARTLLSLWKDSASDPRWRDWMDKQLRRYRSRIDSLDR